ncbi:Parkinson disease 7 domain containing 1 family protein [Toxoplasma gondii VAND]|uniref:Parkinson disease 7 domain containing 1 family protein n=1 Tax=Toxoplasma gondii VAND TaxID=933077 RepID=A0A086QH61_TOXGO|nr:Parkinson disease 7 domain containing 1 family protein [Toxoplasma gondii VAND]
MRAVAAPTPSPFSSVLLVLSSEKRLHLQKPSSGGSSLSSENEAGRASLEFLADAGMPLASLLAIHSILTSSGLSYQIATPAGAPPSICSVDSLSDLDASCLPSALLEKLKTPLPVRSVALENFGGVLFPHSLGAAVDLFNSSALGALVHSLSADKVVCSIGYGGFALAAKRPSGLREDSAASRNKARGGGSSFPFVNYTLTGISPFDECRYPFFGHLPCMLQELLESLGATFASFECIDTPGMVVDRNLVSGANDASTPLCVQTFALLLCCRNASFLAEKNAEREAQHLRETRERLGSLAVPSRAKRESEEAQQWEAVGSLAQRLAGEASLTTGKENNCRVSPRNDPRRATPRGVCTPEAAAGKGEGCGETSFCRLEADVQEQREKHGRESRPSSARSLADLSAENLGRSGASATGEAPTPVEETPDAWGGFQRSERTPEVSASTNSQDGNSDVCVDAETTRCRRPLAFSEALGQRPELSKSCQATLLDVSTESRASASEGLPNATRPFPRASAFDSSLDVALQRPREVDARRAQPADVSAEDGGVSVPQSTQRLGETNTFASRMRSELEPVAFSWVSGSGDDAVVRRPSTEKGAAQSAWRAESKTSVGAGSQEWSALQAEKAVCENARSGGGAFQFLDPQAFSPFARGEDDAQLATDGAFVSAGDRGFVSLEKGENSSTVTSSAVAAGVFSLPGGSRAEEHGPGRDSWAGSELEEDLFSFTASTKEREPKATEEKTANVFASAFPEQDLFQMHRAGAPAEVFRP